MKNIEAKEYPESIEDIAITEFSLVYTQENEILKDGFNDIKLSLGSIGGGHYYILETERWTFNNIEDLINILNDFKNRTKI